MPSSGDLLFTATNSIEFNQYEVNITNARYIKLVGFGRFNSAGDSRQSAWTAIGEIEFYGNLSVAIDEFEDENLSSPIVFPIPANDLLQIKNLYKVNMISIYNVDGIKVMERRTTGKTSELSIDISALPSGPYILSLKGDHIYRSVLFSVSH